MASDLKIALDTIFNHPNVGPFIGKQLIQRLVTSNPSPAYVSRVAAVFNNDGTGVRGNLGAVVKAILTDPEARDDTSSPARPSASCASRSSASANWTRAFKATSRVELLRDRSATPTLAVRPTSRRSTPPRCSISGGPAMCRRTRALDAQSLVAPEFQVVNELSTPTYLNTVHAMIDQGEGLNPVTGRGTDVMSAYANETALAANVPALIARLNTLLFCGSMSSGLQSQISTAVTAVPLPAATSTNAAAVQAAKLNRVKLAILLSMASAEYLTQR